MDSSFNLGATASSLELSVLQQVYSHVLRSDFKAPGFALLKFGTTYSSVNLRRRMVELKRGLSKLLSERANQQLSYLSMGRFDQQVTTKFHLDGAPEQSILMLGYEPSEVQCKIFLADYTKCSFELNIEPKRFLDEYNPMFTKGAELLKQYTSHVVDFDASEFQILVINNSSQPFDPNGTNLLGVMHKAEIVNPDDLKSRIVNSTMLCVSQTEKFSEADQENFITTAHISKTRY